MNKQFKLYWQSFVLTFAFLLTVGIISASAEEPSAQPASRPTRPPEEPVQNTMAIPENVETPARATAQYETGGVFGGVVVPEQIAPSESRAQRAFPEPHFHIQGDLIQHQQEEEAEQTQFLAPEVDELPEMQIPILPGDDSGAPNQPAAPGGFVRQWTAISNSGWIPPDTIHAVGPRHIVEAVNSGFAIYTKWGREVQGYATFENFMNKPAGWAGFMFDPRVIYDPFHQKFLMLVLGKDDTNQKSYFWIAISQTSNPTAGWWIWRWDATDNSGTSTAWLDYAGLGADRWGVYVTGNYFYFAPGFRGGHLLSINPDILNGGATNGWRWIGLTWPSGASAFTLQPAHPHSINSAQQTFFVNTFSSSGNKVLLWKLSGDRTNSPTLTRAEISTPAYNAIGNNVDQPDSDVDIDGGDARVMNAVYADKRVFYTLTTDVQDNGSSAGWLTVKLNTDNNSMEWNDTLWGGAGYYYFYPAITLAGSSNSGNLAVFGSWTRPDGNVYASGLYKIYTNQPTNNTGPLASIVAGLAAYVRLDGRGRNRWGDYSGAGYDWECGHAWGSVESAGMNNTWRTTIGARIFDNEAICPEPVAAAGALGLLLLFF